MHLLGVICHRRGDFDVAIDLFRRAIVIKPDDASFFSNLGNSLQAQGFLNDAIDAHSRAAELAPALAEVHNNLGSALLLNRESAGAAAAFRKAIELKPGYATAHGNLGIVLRHLARHADAIAAFRNAIKLQPDYVEAYFNLGNVLSAERRFAEATAAYAKAIALRPSHCKAHNNLGMALAALQRPEDAIAAFSKAIELDPRDPEPRVNLANTLAARGRLDEAVANYSEAIRAKPDMALAHTNLANTLLESGQLAHAISMHRRAVALDPLSAEIGSNKLFAIHFDPASDASSIFVAHREWSVRHAEPLARLAEPFANVLDAGRRLKIGYVSPDFRNHPVGRFMRPLLTNHDREEYEIFCYSSDSPDELTVELTNLSDHWRNIGDLSDEVAARRVRDDGIDILIDLAMHSGGNRLLMFARKPAPVQMTYLAYCSTTGMQAMDYRLTDPFLDPPDLENDAYCEESIRLPNSWWCFDPAGEMPDVAPVSRDKTGFVTFGCLNNFAKVSPPALDAWCRILQNLPNSRFHLHARNGSPRQHVLKHFNREGIDPGRVGFVDQLPRTEYLREYGKIDIALDTFPFAGGATTCDALWMGVPVVSLAGATGVGRTGASILSNAGLPQFIARSSVEYVRLALELADNPAELSRIRGALREQMRHSPLMNGPAFARNVEAAYRYAWGRYCRSYRN